MTRCLPAVFKSTFAILLLSQYLLSPRLAAEDTAPLSPDKVQVVEVDKAGFEAELAKHKGKVVFVDFWATWCGPCIKRFPHTVELRKELGEKGLEVISLSVDDLDELDAVKEFLARQKATFPNLITKFGIGQETAEAFDVGAVPDFRLYDRQGKLRYRWKDADVAQLKDATIREKIEELLEE